MSKVRILSNLLDSSNDVAVSYLDNVTPYSLPNATDTVIGGIKVGANLTITNGVLAGVNSYSLPTASTTVLGGVKVGANLSISSGVLAGAAPYSLPTSSTTVLGGVKVGNNLTLDPSSGTLHGDAPYSKPSSEPISYISGLQTALNTKTTPAYVDTKVASLVASAPATLDTLDALALALGDDANHVTTMTTLIGTKQSATGDYDVGDNVKIKLGNSDALQIYSAGTHSFIKETDAGHLYIQASNLLLESDDGKNFLYGTDAGVVHLYHDDAPRLTTTSTGIDVTGSVTADDLVIDSTSTTIARFRGSNAGSLYITNDTNNMMTLQGDTGTGISFKTAGNNERMRITSTGNVGIGATTDIDSRLHVKTSNATSTLKLERREVDGILADGDGIGSILFESNDDTAGASGVRAQIDAIIQDSSGGAYLKFSTAGAGSTVSEAMRIVGNGNVEMSGNLQLNSSASAASLEGSVKSYNSGQAQSNAGIEFWTGSYENTGEIRLVTNYGTTKYNRMIINDLGNVGIGLGSATPNRQLVLKDDSLACVQLANTTTGTGSGDGFQLQLSGSTGYLGNYEPSGDIVMFTGASGTERMRIDSTGIDVTGSVTCDGFSSTGINDNATSTAITIDSGEVTTFTQQIRVNGYINSYSDYNAHYYRKADGTTLGYTVFRDNGSNQYSYTSGQDLRFYEGNVERFRLDSAGKANVYSAVTTYTGNLSESVSKAALLIKTHKTDSTVTTFGALSGGHGSIQRSNGPGTTFYSLALNPYGGNVGIGTSSPSYPLDIRGSSPRVHCQENGSTAYASIEGGGSQSYLRFGTGNLKVTGNGADRMTITSTGNVEMSGNLDVTGSVTADVSGGVDNYYFTGKESGTTRYSVYENSNSVYLNTWGSLRLRANQHGGSGGVIALTGGNVEMGGNLDVNGEVTISPNTAGKDTIKFTTNASNDGRLLIKSDTTTKVDIQANGDTYFKGGNVGIGTSDIATPLHVYEETANTTTASTLLTLDSMSTGTTGVGFGGGIQFRGERAGGTLQGMAKISAVADINTSTNLSSALTFQTASGGVNTERMRITSAGNVEMSGDLNVNGELSLTSNHSHRYINPSTNQTSYRFVLPLYMIGNQSYEIRLRGMGNGMLHIKAFASHWTSGYALAREAYLASDAYAAMTQLTQYEYSSTTQGAWSFSRPTSGATGYQSDLIITKSAGSYIGGMGGVIIIEGDRNLYLVSIT